MFKSILSLISAAVLSAACTESYYTLDDFKTVDKIDTHIHINTESNALADLAREDKFQLLNVCGDFPGEIPVEEQERFSIYQMKQNPGRIEYLTAFTLHDWDSSYWADSTIAKLRRSFEAGALGIKIWKNIGMVYKDSAGQFIMIDNPRFDPVIQFVIDQGKTIMGHLGEPKNCWLPLEEMTVNNDRNYFKKNPEYHMYLHPEYPTYEDQINARDRFIERHPDMQFVGAHLGSLEWDVNELAKRLDKYPNMVVDMAARVPHLQYQTNADREKVRNFIIKYQDRLLYGSDSGMSASSDPDEARKYLDEQWQSDWKYFVTDETMTVSEVNGEFKGLKLPKDVIDKIYRINTLKWFKFE